MDQQHKPCPSNQSVWALYPLLFFWHSRTILYMSLKLSFMVSRCLAPVRTIFPDTKMRNTILGFYILNTRPGNIQGSQRALFLCLFISCYKLIGNLTSEEATMFWIVNSRKCTGNPIFWMILAYFLLAVLDSSSDFAPVTTMRPDLKTKAVVLGSRSLMTTAANLLGLYSVFLPFHAINLRSRLHPRSTVDTMF